MVWPVDTNTQAITIYILPNQPSWYLFIITFYRKTDYVSRAAPHPATNLWRARKLALWTVHLVAVYNFTKPTTLTTVTVSSVCLRTKVIEKSSRKRCTLTRGIFTTTQWKLLGIVWWLWVRCRLFTCFWCSSCLGLWIEWLWWWVLWRWLHLRLVLPHIRRNSTLLWDGWYLHSLWYSC